MTEENTEVVTEEVVETEETVTAQEPSRGLAV